MVSLGSVCPYIKYYCLFSGNTSTKFNAYILRDSSMAFALASSVHIPANLQTAPIPVRGGFGPISSRLVSRSIRPLTTLLPSLFLRSGVCGEIVNQLARTCTFSLLIFQKICSLTILISFSPSPMLGRMEQCVLSNLPFSSPSYWENVEPGCLTCCHLHTFPGQT